MIRFRELELSEWIDGLVVCGLAECFFVPSGHVLCFFPMLHDFSLECVRDSSEHCSAIVDCFDLFCFAEYLMDICFAFRASTFEPSSHACFRIFQV